MAVCPGCGKENPDGFQFCGYCGDSLKGTLEHAPAQERKVVSVLFCDVVGFTAASESADPEDVQARMQAYYDRLRNEIESFGGTVSKFIGDAVMAVFGVPVVHEDDAERAVRAGLRILESIAELNEVEPGLSLQVRVGVNTGEVVVSHSDGDFNVLGDVVNTASRIQAASPVGAVAVGAETFESTERIFRYEELPAFEAKGKSKPVVVWRPLEAVARFGSDVIRKLTTPLIGRQADFALLRSLFDRAAHERQVQMVTIVGEPGVGKSRLVAELFSHIDNLSDLITWRQGRCLPYGDGITFWALGEIVKAHAGIFESDSAEVATAKIEAVLSEGDDRPWFRARLLPLVGVETGQPASREESFTAWRRFLENIAEEGPTIVVVEDIHWADEALLDFLEHLADWAQGVPMVVACTARPELYERRQAWGAGLSNHTPIRLNRLTDVETARLVAVLLNQTVLPAETQQLVLERASGNPLYAEEFARMLRDRDLLDEHGRLRSDSDVAVPDSIQALIAARLDTLPPARKQLLQDAAVVGKVFWAGAIAAMGGRPSDEVEVALHELSRKELVRPSRQTSMAGETEYGFWHVLVRDVSYGQIPRHERAVRHAKAADWIEKKAGERVEDLAEVLAFHSGAARDNALATGNTALADEMAPRLRRFAALAGERAAGLDTGKALQLLSKALELTPTDDPERAEVLVRWGTAALDAGKARAASDAFGEAVALARATDQGERLAAALIALSRVQRDLSGEGGVDYAREAVTALSGLPPGRSLTEAWAYLSVATMLSGGYSAAIDSAEESFRIAADLGLPPPSTAFQGRASARCMMGDVGGLADGRRAIELSVEEGAGGSAGIQYNNLGIDTLLFEGPERAFSVFDEGMAFAAPRGLVRGMNTIRSSRVCMLPLAGRLTETILEADELIPLLQEGGDNLDRFLVMSARCYALQELGVPEPEAAELLLGAMSRVDADLMVDAAIAAAPTRMAMADIRGALDILEELSEFDGLEESTDYAFLSTALVRCAIEAGSAPLANKLCSRVQPGLPMASVARAACEALTAEMRGEPPEASARFAAVAADWKAFGCRLEYAYALLGQGRCLAAIDDPSAVRVLQWALSEFDQMGAKPRVEECKVLLTAAAATSA